jgi:hypothetical protein
VEQLALWCYVLLCAFWLYRAMNEDRMPALRPLGGAVWLLLYQFFLNRMFLGIDAPSIVSVLTLERIFYSHALAAIAMALAIASLVSLAKHGVAGGDDW